MLALVNNYFCAPRFKIESNVASLYTGSPRLDPLLPLTKTFFSGFGAKHETGEQQFYVSKRNL